MCTTLEHVFEQLKDLVEQMFGVFERRQRRRIARRPWAAKTPAACCISPGASAEPRTTPPRQPGTARTTRREPTSETAAVATASTDRIGPPDHTSCDPSPAGSW